MTRAMDRAWERLMFLEVLRIWRTRRARGVRVRVKGRWGR